MSDSRFTIIVLLVLLLLAITGACYLYFNKPPSTTTVQTVTIPVPVEHHQQGVVSGYEPDSLDGESYKTAYYHAKIDTNKVKGSLDIRYSERTSLFDVDLKLTALKDSITVTKTITITRPLGFIVGVTPVISRDINNRTSVIIQADAGLRFNDKWDISITAATDKTYGLRIGRRF